MSRYLTLVIFGLWFVWTSSSAPAPTDRFGWNEDLVASLLLFLGGFLCIVLLMGLYSRTLARNVLSHDLNRMIRRFNRAMFSARLLIPVWLAIGLWALNWGQVVRLVLGPVDRLPIELPGLLIGTLPAFLTMMGLWWAQFPADTSLREQSMLEQLNDNLPVHAPPRFWPYIVSNLRIEILFTVVPVALIVLLRDLAALGMWQMGLTPIGPGGAAQSNSASALEAVVQLGAALVIFVFAPEILRRVLHTEPLPPSRLRDRLDEMCTRSNLDYRDILLWRTGGNMANAAVMGIIPQVRYVLLSDLLLETMSDEQIEAVFAHELGHVVHRHLVWYAILVATFICGSLSIDATMARLHWSTSGQVMDVMLSLLGIAVFFLLFSYVSRWFERQADVYAARTMQLHNGAASIAQLATLPAAEPMVASARKTADLEPISYVGDYGARVFGAALHRVAVINNIPLAARNFSHGSIAQRMQYLQDLSGDPSRTGRFDRVMTALYMTLLGALVLGSTTAVALMLTQR